MVARKKPAEEQEPESTEPEQVEEGTTDAEAQVQTAVDKENEQGYRGAVQDPTPNENYTVAGVSAGLPTPETDKDTAEEIAGQALTKFTNKNQ